MSSNLLGVIASQQSGPEVQAAGACVGPFSAANYWSDTTPQRGPDFIPGTVLNLLVWSTGDNDQQVMWCYNESTTSGWRLQHAGGQRFNILLSNVTYQSLTNMRLGLNNYAVQRMQDGSVRSSLNGGAAGEIVAAPVYVNAGVTARHGIGRSIVPNQQAINTRILAGAVLRRAVGDYSDAELEAISGAANGLNRWQLADGIFSDPNLFFGYRFEDWDGVTVALPLFANVGGYSIDRNGTGGTLQTLPSYLRYRIPPPALDDNARFVPANNGTPPGTKRYSIFSQTRFQSDAQDNVSAGLIVDIVRSEDVGDGEGENKNCGVLIDGVAPTGNSGVGTLIVEEKEILRAIDCLGVPAGAAKQFEVITGIQRWPGDYFDDEPIKGFYPQYIRVPQSTPLSWIKPVPPADKIVVFSDGHLIQVEGAPVISATFQSWPMLARANAGAGWGFSCEGWQSRAGYTLFGTVDYRTSNLEILRKHLTGTSSNTLWMDFGTTDYNHINWGVPPATGLSNFGDALGAWLDLIHAEFPALIIYVALGVPITYGLVPSFAGWTITPELEAVINATCAARAFVTYVDARLWVSGAGIGSSGTYYTELGHQQYEAQFRAIIGY